MHKDPISCNLPGTFGFSTHTTARGSPRPPSGLMARWEDSVRGHKSKSARERGAWGEVWGRPLPVESPGTSWTLAATCPDHTRDGGHPGQAHLRRCHSQEVATDTAHEPRPGFLSETCPRGGGRRHSMRLGHTGTSFHHHGALLEPPPPPPPHP